MEMLGNEPIIDIDSARSALKALSPELVWLLRQIESDGGYVRFPRQVNEAISNLRIEAYPRLYENEAAIAYIFLNGFLDAPEIMELSEELDAASPSERGELLLATMEESLEALEKVNFPMTPAEEKAARKLFDALSPEDQKEAWRFSQHFWMGFLATFHQLLSVMVHGEKLTALVAKAMSGDDEAFGKAVQIDKRILSNIPALKQRFERAHSEGNLALIDALSYRLQCPPYKGKIRHKALWFAFAYLDMCGLLDSLKHQELLDLLDDAGLGGFPNRIEDVKHLSKRLADFRRFRGYGLTLSTP
jgi:hypothetical protein